MNMRNFILNYFIKNQIDVAIIVIFWLFSFVIGLVFIVEYFQREDRALFREEKFIVNGAGKCRDRHFILFTIL